MKRMPLLSIALCFGLQACGVSMEGLTDPAKKDRDKADQLRRENEEKERQAQATQALYSRLAFNLQSEADACERSKQGADYFKVEMVGCVLENDALTVSVKDPVSGLSHSETFSFAASDDALQAQAKAVEGMQLQRFFTAMAGVVAYSKKNEAR